MRLSPETLHARLESLSGQTIMLRINNNTSSLLTVSWKEVKKTKRSRNNNTQDDILKVSISHIFLDAPDEVIGAVGQFLRRSTRKSRATIRRYINENYHKIKAPKDSRPPDTKGTYFDLQPLLDKVNEQYFNGTLELKACWGSKHNARAMPARSRRSRRKRTTRWNSIQFASYDENRRLIRVNPRLDNPRIPAYFLEYILYHEMLHAVIPPKIRPSGRLMVHTGEFKRRERRFSRYEDARRWEDICLKIL